MILSYFNIVRKNIQDAVPKAIMFFLVNRSKDQIQSELVKTLYRDDLFEELLRENEDIAFKRKACIDLLAILRKAISIVNEIRDIDAFRL